MRARANSLPCSSHSRTPSCGRSAELRSRHDGKVTTRHVSRHATSHQQAPLRSTLGCRRPLKHRPTKGAGPSAACSHLRLKLALHLDDTRREQALLVLLRRHSTAGQRTVRQHSKQQHVGSSKPTGLCPLTLHARLMGWARRPGGAQAEQQWAAAYFIARVARCQGGEVV